LRGHLLNSPAATWVLRAAGSKYFRNAALAAAMSARAASVCRDSTPRRAFSNLNFRFSRRKNAWSGASSTASGSSMRLTRTRLRASSRMSSRTVCHHARRGAGGGLRAAAAVPVPATAFTTGSSSTSRASSSSLTNRPGTSVTLAARTRPMSRAIAARARASRGCAARSSRLSALRNSASSGSALPVN